LNPAILTTVILQPSGDTGAAISDTDAAGVDPSYTDDTETASVDSKPKSDGTASDAASIPAVKYDIIRTN
jgi:hypothetical protein